MAFQPDRGADMLICCQVEMVVSHLCYPFPSSPGLEEDHGDIFQAFQLDNGASTTDRRQVEMGRSHLHDPFSFPHLKVGGSEPSP